MARQAVDGARPRALHRAQPLERRVGEVGTDVLNGAGARVDAQHPPREPGDGVNHPVEAQRPAQVLLPTGERAAQQCEARVSRVRGAGYRGGRVRDRRGPFAPVFDTFFSMTFRRRSVFAVFVFGRDGGALRGRLLRAAFPVRLVALRDAPAPRVEAYLLELRGHAQPRRGRHAERGPRRGAPEKRRRQTRRGVSFVFVSLPSKTRARHPVPRRGERAAGDSVQHAAREHGEHAVAVVRHLRPRTSGTSGTSGVQVLQPARALLYARRVVRHHADERGVGVRGQQHLIKCDALGPVPLDMPLRVVAYGPEAGLEPAPLERQAPLERGEHLARGGERRAKSGAGRALEVGGGFGVVGGHAEESAVGEHEALSCGVVRGAPARGVRAGGMRRVRVRGNRERVAGRERGDGRHRAARLAETRRHGSSRVIVHSNAPHAAALQALGDAVEARGVGIAQRRGCGGTPAPRLAASVAHHASRQRGRARKGVGGFLPPASTFWFRRFRESVAFHEENEIRASDRVRPRSETRSEGPRGRDRDTDHGINRGR